MKFERFVKKPVVVDVIQYQGVVIDCLKNDTRIKWCGDELPDDAISVHTLDGIEICHKGDYIIRGNQGELYTCCANVFETDYERAPVRKRRTPKEDDTYSVVTKPAVDVFEADDEDEGV
jgi:hypothetical protein